MLHSPDDLAPAAAQFYRKVMQVLGEANLPFLVGGGYAFYSYTTILRDTKDFDVFVLPEVLDDVLATLSAAGWQTDQKFPHWLAKVYHEGYFVDIIYNSGNGICPVDQQWFDSATRAEILGQSVLLSPVEEMIWQKSFIKERHRYDGSDIVHLLHYHSESLNWERLLRRFGDYWMVLLSHLILYRFIYPDDRPHRAEQILRQLLERWQQESTQDTDVRQPPRCRGTLLSLVDYLPAIEKWGYQDARLRPWGSMTSADVDLWTNEFEK
jgi:hypothetical protein